MMTGTPAAQSPTDAYGLAKLCAPDNVPKFFGAFRDMVMGLSAIIMQVRSGSKEVGKTSLELARASEQSARNNDSVATAGEETTATVHEMSVNIQNVAASSKIQYTHVKQTTSSVEEMVRSTIDLTIEMHCPPVAADLDFDGKFELICGLPS